MEAWRESPNGSFEAYRPPVPYSRNFEDELEPDPLLSDADPHPCFYTPPPPHPRDLMRLITKKFSALSLTSHSLYFALAHLF